MIEKLPKYLWLIQFPDGCILEAVEDRNAPAVFTRHPWRQESLMLAITSRHPSRSRSPWFRRKEKSDDSLWNPRAAQETVVPGSQRCGIPRSIRYAAQGKSGDQVRRGHAPEGLRFAASQDGTQGGAGMMSINYIPTCDREQQESRAADFEAAFDAAMPADPRNVDALLQSANDILAAFAGGGLKDRRTRAIARLENLHAVAERESWLRGRLVRLPRHLAKLTPRLANTRDTRGRRTVVSDCLRPGGPGCSAD